MCTKSNNYSNLFVADSETKDCYLRLRDLCKIFDVDFANINSIINNIPCVYVENDGRVLQSGLISSQEKAFNFENITKIYSLLSLQKIDILHTLEQSYKEARYNAYFD